MTNRLAAGPGGPISLRKYRAAQKAATTAAIEAACDRLMNDEIRPTIETTLEAGTGFKRTSLRRYKHVLHAKQREFDRIKGDVAEAQPAAGTSSGPSGSRDLTSTLPSAEVLQRRLDVSNSLLERRDGQLALALATIQKERKANKRLREENRDLIEELEADRSEPLPRRKR